MRIHHMRRVAVYFMAAGVLLLGCTAGCDSRRSDTQIESAPRTGKSKMGLIVLGDIRNESGNGVAVAISSRGKRTLKKGDTLQLGEEIHCSKFTQAEIRFDGRALVLLDENSAIALMGHPTVKLLSGNVAISRQVGAPAPFVFGLDNDNYSIIQGKILAERTSANTGLEVASGEVLKLDTNVYLGTGDRISTAPQPRSPGDTAPAETQPKPASSAGFVPPNWFPPITPVEQQAMVSLSPKVRRGIGTLAARNPQTNRTAQNAMKMNAHKVNVQIQEGVAITEVEEQFTNTSKVTVEATYRFLVPKDALITRLALDINGRIEEGEVLEKKHAARIFRQIVDDSVRPKDPALLEWERGSEFKMKIFPIKPGETRRVFLTYTTPMTYFSGCYRYEYPLANPKGTVPVDTFSLTASIDTPQPIRNVRTPLFASSIAKKLNHAALTFETRQTAPLHDFVITFETAPFPGGMRSLVQTEKNGQSFGMFLWHPDTDDDATPAPPRRVVAMVDVSYDISKEMIALAAATLVELIGGLAHDDRFNVLACDSSCKPLFHEFKSPGAAAIMQMYNRIITIQGGGASNLLGNFQQAFNAAGNAPNTAVVYMGDGVATSGELDSARLISLLSKTKPDHLRVHTVGIGPDIDSKVLARMAAQLNGMNYNLSFGDSPASASWHLSRMFASDALSSIRATLQADDGHQYRLYPDQIGFLPAGQSVELLTSLGTLPSGVSKNATLTITATRPGGHTVNKEYHVALQPPPPARGFVSRLWAAKYIDDLEFTGDHNREIIDASRQYRVASRLTSWIVLENQRMYDRFNVVRTNGEQYDMSPAEFADAEDATPPELSELDDIVSTEIGDDADKSTPLPRRKADSAYGSSAGNNSRVSSASRNTAPKKSKASGDYADPISGPPASTPAPQAESKVTKREMPVEDRTVSRPWPHCDAPGYRVSISKYSVSGPNALARKNQLQNELHMHPLSRSIHRRYVRQLARMENRDEAMNAANNWRQSDAFSTAALRAYAGEVARGGHRNDAMRLYDSISEIMPTDTGVHRRLAQTFRDMGNFAAAAGHYGAIWSLTFRNKNGVTQDAANDWLDYLFALVMSGQHQLFETEILSARNQIALAKVSTRIAELKQGLQTGILPDWPTHTSKGVLKIQLMSNNDDLDILLVDPLSRVSGGLWRFGVGVDGFNAKGRETLWTSNLLNGTYQVVVARGDGETSRVSSGAITIHLRGKTQRIPFEFNGPSKAVAKISHQLLRNKYCYRY